MEILKLAAPHGTAWDLLVAVLVIVAGPILVERVRIPGLIGLLAGGCIIGPNVLAIVESDTGVVRSLGQLGLLYLMFVAGLELDFTVFGRFKRQAAGFSLLTFALPLGLGVLAGLIVGYGPAASLLLGSLFASYTLVVYPIVRNLGLSSNGAVATAVGATVVTDTLALVVLAAIAGSATGDAGGLELGLQIVLGLAILGAFCFGVLPRVGRWFFGGIGGSRPMRYGFVLISLLGSGVLAESVGIEAIVGAFFAGLALNRLVPNGGEFMERIEFFGSALLVPIFLVSVGTIIDPMVLIDPGTLGVAAIFTVACVGGKSIAALLCRPLFGFTFAEVGVVFGLSVAQAAATLAATFVGLQIGLFTSTTVNAVMIVIVVSLVLASSAAERFGRQVPVPEDDTTRIGRCVVTHVTDPADVPIVLGFAARVAEQEGGIVRPVAIAADGEFAPSPELLAASSEVITRLGLDAHVEVRHDSGVNEGILHASRSFDASLLVLAAETQSWLPTLLGAAQHSLVAASPAPTVLVRPGSSEPKRVVLVLAPTQARRPTSAAHLAARLAVRLAGGEAAVHVVSATEPAASLAALVGKGRTVLATPTDWVREHGGADDLIVVPGGRNGALATARVAKAAAAVGATVAVAADRESVSMTEQVRLVGSAPASELTA